MTYKLLFVCTGNICRSPTAEGIFRHLADEAGLADRFSIDSAGTHGYHEGEPPDSRSIITARQNGVDLSGQTARSLRMEDYHEFDLILAMAKSHLNHMQQQKPPDGRAEIELFLDYLPDFKNQDVPDPWYGHEDGFQHVFDLVHSGCEALLRQLQAAELKKQG
ncbi:MAG: low molecular weight phosphotyrosine protein phosphatase [Micavibrio sp.]|nr:MAG: low molecular weight phosphotyrosine protein phosphatase [Micavibrio sp.]